MWRPRSRGRSRRRPLAVVTPLPPSHTGIAAYSARLLRAAAAQREVVVYVDGPEADAVDARALEPLRVRPLERFAARDAGDLLVCLGNSPYHVGGWRLLREAGGDVLLHEVALWGLYWGLDARGLLPDGLAARVRAVDGCTFEEAMERPCAMVGEVVAAARRVFVHTETARSLLLERHPDADVAVVTFALPPVAPSPEPRGDPVVASFGHQREAEIVLEAFALVARELPAAGLWLVGEEYAAGQLEALREAARTAGVDDRVTLTGWVGEEEYRRRIAATTVALQPRGRSFGERSGALGDLLAAGVPAVVTDASHADGVPDTAVVRVPRQGGAAGLAAAVVGLLRDGPRRAAMRSAAVAYATAHGAERAAADLLSAIGR